METVASLRFLVPVAGLLAVILMASSSLAVTRSEGPPAVPETALFDGRTLDERTLLVWDLVDRGENARALVEATTLEREVGGVPAIQEARELAVSNLREEIRVMIDGETYPRRSSALAALKRIERIVAVAGERPGMTLLEARAHWLLGDHSSEVAALDRWLTTVPDSHPKRACMESTRSLAEAAIVEASRFAKELGHLPSPFPHGGWSDLDYAAALDLPNVIAALLADPDMCGEGKHRWFVDANDKVDDLTNDARRILGARTVSPPSPVSDDWVLSTLSIAVVAKAYGAAKELLRRGADPDMRVARNWRAAESSMHCRVALCWAAVGNHHEIVKLLIDHGARVGGFQQSLTPLIAAVRSKHLEMVRLLLDAGAETDYGDEEGIVPLYHAVSANHLDIARLLLDHGADVNESPLRRLAPLSLAVLRNHHEMVELLVERGAEFDEAHLLEAVKAKAFETAEFLIGRGADVNATIRGEKLLFIVVEKQAIEGARFLIERNADIDGRGNRGLTALFSAVSADNLEMAKLLVEHDADVNAAATYSGSTPLHEAAHRGAPEMAKLLVEHGADATIRDRDGMTPSDLALKAGHFGLAFVIAPGPIAVDEGES